MSFFTASIYPGDPSSLFASSPPASPVEPQSSVPPHATESSAALSAATERPLSSSALRSGSKSESIPCGEEHAGEDGGEDREQIEALRVNGARSVNVAEVSGQEELQVASPKCSDEANAESVAQRVAHLRAYELKEDDVGRAIRMENGTLRGCHAIWAEHVLRLARAVPDVQGILIADVRAALPVAVQRCLRREYHTWPGFTAAVGSIDLNILRARQEHQTESARRLEGLTECLRLLDEDLDAAEAYDGRLRAHHERCRGLSERIQEAIEEPSVLQENHQQCLEEHLDFLREHTFRASVYQSQCEKMSQKLKHAIKSVEERRTLPREDIVEEAHLPRAQTPTEHHEGSTSLGDEHVLEAQGIAPAGTARASAFQPLRRPENMQSRCGYVPGAYRSWGRKV